MQPDPSAPIEPNTPTSQPANRSAGPVVIQPLHQEELETAIIEQRAAEAAQRQLQQDQRAEQAPVGVVAPAPVGGPDDAQLPPRFSPPVSPLIPDSQAVPVKIAWPKVVFIGALLPILYAILSVVVVLVLAPFALMALLLGPFGLILYVLAYGIPIIISYKVVTSYLRNSVQLEYPRYIFFSLLAALIVGELILNIISAQPSTPVWLLLAIRWGGIALVGAGMAVLATLITNVWNKNKPSLKRTIMLLIIFAPVLVTGAVYTSVSIAMNNAGKTEAEKRATALIEAAKNADTSKTPINFPVYAVGALPDSYQGALEQTWRYQEKKEMPYIGTRFSQSAYDDLTVYQYKKPSTFNPPVSCGESYAPSYEYPKCANYPSIVSTNSHITGIYSIDDKGRLLVATKTTLLLLDGDDNGAPFTEEQYKSVVDSIKPTTLSALKVRN